MSTPSGPTATCHDARPARFRCRFAHPAIALALLAAGCSFSPISKPLRQAALGQPPFQAIQANPEAYRGRAVLLGGSIVQTVNQPNITEIEVLQRPLDSTDDSPADTDQSQGRFLVQYRVQFQARLSRLDFYQA